MERARISDRPPDYPRDYPYRREPGESSVSLPPGRRERDEYISSSGTAANPRLAPPPTDYHGREQLPPPPSDYRRQPESSHSQRADYRREAEFDRRDPPAEYRRDPPPTEYRREPSTEYRREPPPPDFRDHRREPYPPVDYRREPPPGDYRRDLHPLGMSQSVFEHISYFIPHCTCRLSTT